MTVEIGLLYQPVTFTDFLLNLLLNFFTSEEKQINASLTYESPPVLLKFFNNKTGKADTNYLIDQQRFEV